VIVDLAQHRTAARRRAELEPPAPEPWDPVKALAALEHRAAKAWIERETQLLKSELQTALAAPPSDENQAALDRLRQWARELAPHAREVVELRIEAAQKGLLR
jgi:hypothetical protein